MQQGQCMLEPKVEARMLQDLHVQPHEKVLEVGAGSGYMAALLAHRAQRVLQPGDRIPSWRRWPRDNLQRAGITNAEVREADGAEGLPAEAPFDVIVLSGSVAEVPQALLAQLKVGGRLAAIVGDEPVMRATFITRTGETSYTTAQPWDTVAPRLAQLPRALALPVLRAVSDDRPSSPGPTWPPGAVAAPARAAGGARRARALGAADRQRQAPTASSWSPSR